MPIIDLADFTEIPSVPEGSVFILGFFDGVHLGHRALIAEAKRIAIKLGGVKICVWTFDSLPKVAAKTLTTTEEKCHLFSKEGVDFIILESFESLKSTDGDVFFSDYLVKTFSPSAVVCGFNFAFGKGASHKSDDLEKLARESGVVCSVVAERAENGKTVSSSRIRELIENGEIEEANRLLGSPYTVSSTIEHGVQIGRKMGVRTINQRLPNGKVSPKKGVYCCTVTFNEDGKNVTYGGVCNIGSRPTVNENEADITVETHIFDFDGEIYGSIVTTSLYHLLREERKFSDLDSLKNAIQEDSARAKELLKNIL